MGNIAALAVSLLWALSSIFFSKAGNIVGSLVVNRVRLLFASAFLLITHWLMIGYIFPPQLDWEHFTWLGLSGIIGLAIGDTLLFQAYVMIGPRLSTLIMSGVPVISAFIAWVFLGQQLNALQLTGIGVTMAGIAWVILERRANGTEAVDKKKRLYGALFGIGAAIGQALGLVFSKMGLSDDFPVISGVLIRIWVAMIVTWIITLFQGKATATLSTLSNRRVLGFLIVGSFVGPYIGVWLSLVAVDLIPVGIASTLIALTPIFLLPLSRIFFNEKVSLRATFGTIGAMAGVALIFLAP